MTYPAEAETTYPAETKREDDLPRRDGERGRPTLLRRREGTTYPAETERGDDLPRRDGERERSPETGYFLSEALPEPRRMMRQVTK
jgi:hypothetical protein